MPRPARTSARCDWNSIATCAIRGRRPVPCVHPGEPLTADGALGRCDPALVDEVVRSHPRAGRQRVAGVHDRRRPRRRRARWSTRWSGMARSDVAPAVHDADVGLTGGHQVDGVPGLALGQASATRSGYAVAQVAHAGCDESAHRGREGGDAQVSRRRCRRWWCRPDSRLSRSASRRRAASTRCRPSRVSITPRPTRSSRATLVWRSRRLTCWDTALGVKPSASAARNDRPVGVDGAERGQGGEIDHVAMLHGSRP